MARKSPVEVLFGSYHRRILSLLLLRPDQSFYVRQIARLIKAPAGSLHRELKRLEASGLLLREVEGNQVRYRANLECPIFPELAGIFRKTSGLADVLKEALAPLVSPLDLAFIFGSVARGKEDISSDIDVFVIGSVPFTAVVQVFARVHECLGREINPIVAEKDDFARKYQRGDRFVTRVMNEPRIFLMGTEDDLGKLVENRAA